MYVLIQNIDAITTQVSEWNGFGYSLFKKEWKMPLFKATSGKLIWCIISIVLLLSVCVDFSTILSAPKLTPRTISDTAKNVFTFWRKIWIHTTATIIKEITINYINNALLTLLYNSHINFWENTRCPSWFKNSTCCMKNISTIEISEKSH